MSDALNYLISARPDAVLPYFKFLKEAGKNLDPKTRDLISVITKVHSQTDKGFRQYLSRALHDGVKPIEILDALLMAFPALGLAKIIWAVEILQEMDIPEFRPENLNTEGSWHDIIAISEATEGGITYRECDGRNLYIYRKGDTVRVYDSRCPHQVTDIPHLALDGSRLTCPKHNWTFDVATGDCVEKGERPLRLFESKIEAGRLVAFW
jgi:nitrite reductase/ring-hydroxylating ferredoxin subunit/alkylhydroperoxidase/carboxymuconolactone decarboxylase family protein YurZ